MISMGSGWCWAKIRTLSILSMIAFWYIVTVPGVQVQYLTASS